MIRLTSLPKVFTANFAPKRFDATAEEKENGFKVLMQLNLINGISRRMDRRHEIPGRFPTHRHVRCL